MKINKYKQFIKENNQFNYSDVDEYLTKAEINWGIVNGQYIGKFEGENLEKIMSNHRQWLIGLREDFAELIKDCASGSSYSDLCKKKTDPNMDVEEVQKDLDECGWNLQSILNLFSQEVDTLTNQKFEDFINSYGLDNENGIVDIYLYKLAEILGKDSNIVELGGGGWSEYTTDPDEILIRYAYGYHNTKYGKLMLDQVRLSREKFIELALQELKSLIIKELSKGDDEISSELNKSIIVDDDRLVIDVDYLLDISKQFGILSSIREEMISELIRHIDGYGLEVIDVGSDLIFSEKSDN